MNEQGSHVRQSSEADTVGVVFFLTGVGYSGAGTTLANLDTAHVGSALALPLESSPDRLDDPSQIRTTELHWKMRDSASSGNSEHAVLVLVANVPHSSSQAPSPHPLFSEVAFDSHRTCECAFVLAPEACALKPKIAQRSVPSNVTLLA